MVQLVVELNEGSHEDTVNEHYSAWADLCNIQMYSNVT